MDIIELKTDRSWVEIDLDALKHNVHEISSLLSEKSQIMAVIKADAYGHGAIIVAKELESLGITFFAVATIDEAITLRKNNIQSDILILGYTSYHLAHFLKEYRLTQTVIDYNYGRMLNDMHYDINIHIKIDSGMHRLGENYQDISHIKKIYQLSSLHVTGLFSHLCVADSQRKEDILFTKEQFSHFHKTINQLESAGLNVGKVHMQSSYGLLNYNEEQFDFARIGISLYGVQSSVDDYIKNRLELKPVLSIQSRVACIHQIKKGASIGYGRTYQLQHNSMIAVVPLGYADGLPRHLSSHQDVLIHGQRAPIIGRICMDQLMVDVTHIQNIHINDIVTIVGENGNQRIHIEELSKNAQTISNEILSRIGQRLPKIYIKKGKVIYENT